MDLRFINEPFPDNHNGFDYSPKSVQDIISEESAKKADSHAQATERNILTMLASIFK